MTSDQAHNAARLGVDHLIGEVARAEDPAAFTVRPLFEGARTTVTRPTPLAAITAGRLVAGHATGAVHQAVRDARSNGDPWDAIGSALGLTVDNPYDLAVAAFEWESPRSEDYPMDRMATYWRCGGPGGCGQLVTDYGPYESNPDDNEQNHADGCERHARAVAVWRTRMEYDA